MNYSKINHPVRALKTGRIVRWKGKKKIMCYGNGISLDSTI